MVGASNGQYSRFLSFHGRNPDVLNSIANLSNDEVFTPPEFANRMLDTLEKAWAESHDGEIIWQNSTLKFLDPFTKSGVFLREIATRLIKGLEGEMPDLQARVDHILTKQVYGIATTKLTSLMARRSLYCSKKANGKHSVTKKFNNEDGNIWFQPTKHEWVGGKTKIITADKHGNEIEKTVDGKCKFCGASKRDFDREEGLELHAYGLIHNDDPKKWVSEVYGEEMQFDVVIGNPPYQLEDGGHASSSAPLYHKFVDAAIKLDPKLLAMVIPARWYAGGKGLDTFREQMLSNSSIRFLADYTEASEVFPGVKVEGGICYFLWERSYIGPTRVETRMPNGAIASSHRHLGEPGLDVFIRYETGLTVLQKIFEIHGAVGEDFADFMTRSDWRFESMVSSRKPFGLPTNFKGSITGSKSSLTLHQNGGTAFIERTELTTGAELIDEWKIFISYAYGTGNTWPKQVLGKPILGGPGTVCTETYLVIGPFASHEIAKNALSYMSSRFFRFLVMLRKPAQHATRAVYGFVPTQDFSEPLDDEALFKRYKLDAGEVSFICEVIKQMDDGHDRG
jgi:site-specific DNA-methyltransferase (adenine-specific)